MAAAFIVAPLELSLWMKGSVLVVIGASLCRALWRHAWLRSADAITTIEIEDGEPVVRRREGRCERSRLLGTTYVSPQLTILNLRVAGRILPQHMLIVPDNVDPDAFRRMRVWLRWDCGRDGSSAAGH